MLSLTRLTIRRAREGRLPQVAGSLTLTTVLSIVPFLAVSFALFTRFPIFRRLEDAIKDHLLKGLLPDDISRTVMRHLNHFAANANGLALVGSLCALAAAVALLLTVENALNQIWEVKKGRPFLKRIGLYLLMLGVGPPLLGASVWVTSYLLGVSMGIMGPDVRSMALLLNLGPVLLGMLGLACVYYFMPNATVRRRDALAGGLIGSVGFELGKRGFAAWLIKVPTYKAVYGAFAAFPVFLLWVYFSWLVTLTAALITANLAPVKRQQRVRPARAQA
jgi:membrane protein